MSVEDAGWGNENLDLRHHPLFVLFDARFWYNFFDMGHIPNKHSKICFGRSTNYLPVESVGAA